MLLNLLGTANDWERFLVTAPQDAVLHLTGGLDAWTAIVIVSHTVAYLLTRRK